MKIEPRQVARAVDRPDPAIRFYLFYGPDEGGSRALAARLAKALGGDERVDLSGSVLKTDPARLADEAGAYSMFGGRRLLWIEPAGEDVAAAVGALLDLPGCETPTVALAGALKKTSGLLKLVEASPAAAAVQSYAPEGDAALRLVDELARAHGLELAPGVAARLIVAAGNQRGIFERELEKYALFCGASPESPMAFDEAMLDTIGIGDGEADLFRLGDLALAGMVGPLGDELGRLDPHFNGAIPALRALQRRVVQIAPLAARVARGEAPDRVVESAGKALMYRDKSIVGQILRRQWSPAALSRALERASELERDLMFQPLPPAAALGDLMLTLARAAARKPVGRASARR